MQSVGNTMSFVNVAITGFTAYQQMQAAFRTIHPELEDASRILGATRLRSLWQITAPLLRTGVIADPKAATPAQEDPPAA